MLLFQYADCWFDRVSVSSAFNIYSFFTSGLTETNICRHVPKCVLCHFYYMFCPDPFKLRLVTKKSKICRVFPTVVYIKFEYHIFAPPPFLIYIYFPNEIYYNEGLALFCCNFVNFESIGEKICILFTYWWKNMYFPPFFIPFQSCYLAKFS